MITTEFARDFAREWIAAWNSHDIERVLAHYADDFEMSSPYIARLAGEASGKLEGKGAVRDYWNTALARMPGLRFDHVDALAGADSVAIYYKGVRGMACELFFFDDEGKVKRAFAHYAQDP